MEDKIKHARNWPLQQWRQRFSAPSPLVLQSHWEAPRSARLDSPHECMGCATFSSKPLSIEQHLIRSLYNVWTCNAPILNI